MPPRGRPKKKKAGHSQRQQQSQLLLAAAQRALATQQHDDDDEVVSEQESADQGVELDANDNTQHESSSGGEPDDSEEEQENEQEEEENENENDDDDSGDNSTTTDVLLKQLLQQMKSFKQQLDAVKVRDKKRVRFADEDNEVKSAAASSSSSKVGEQAKTVPSTESVPAAKPCALTYDEAVKFCSSVEELVAPCKLCGKPNNQHARTKPASSAFRMPPASEFPVFRDPSDSRMSDPRLFFNKLERALRFHSVPEELWKRVLVSCVHDELMQQWIEGNIVPADKCKSWTDVVKAFSSHYIDPSLKNKYAVQLEKLRQGPKERVHAYGEKYMNLMSLLNYQLTNAAHVFKFERGFTYKIRAELAKIKVQRATVKGSDYEFKSIPEVIEAAQAVELALEPAQGRGDSVEDDDVPSFSQRRSGMKRPRISKLEVNADGVPHNVNKKHKSRGGRGGSNRGGSVSGPSRGRGGLPRGRGTRGRGTGRVNTQSSDTFGGTCFVCGETGHRAFDCPARVRTNMVGVAPVDRAVYVRACELRRGLHIESPQMPGIHSVLLDTGAQFSAISSALAHKHKLHIFSPRKGETRYITLADRSKHVARVGFVVIPITVHFDGGKPRKPFECKMRLEVLNMSYDFILGVDILPSLFPTDDIMDFLIRPASIATDSVVVDEETEGCRFGKQVLTYGMQESVEKVDKDSCVNDYVSDRVRANFDEKLKVMFDDDLPGMFSRVEHSLRASAMSVQPESVSVSVDVGGGHYLRTVATDSSAGISSAAASN